MTSSNDTQPSSPDHVSPKSLGILTTLSQVSCWPVKSVSVELLSQQFVFVKDELASICLSLTDISIKLNSLATSSSTGITSASQDPPPPDSSFLSSGRLPRASPPSNSPPSPLCPPTLPPLLPTPQSFLPLTSLVPSSPSSPTSNTSSSLSPFDPCSPSPTQEISPPSDSPLASQENTPSRSTTQTSALFIHSSHSSSPFSSLSPSLLSSSSSNSSSSLLSPSPPSPSPSSPSSSPSPTTNQSSQAASCPIPVCRSSTSSLSSLTIISLNTRSIVANFHLLISAALLHSPDLIYVSETWLCPEVLSSELYIPGYSLFRLDRSCMVVVMLFMLSPVSSLQSSSFPLTP
uniref:Endonuclease/exonuclease/phosphatase domain-containing protein n=1 Tax=Amphimedon queenslandica TaxID=400682 RepID=A0A1X7TDK7_AMPQE